ncbi:MAG: beta-ketoacyl-ACP synthase III [Vicingaceae bacterium]|nr:beta-ketoacyl-ACP synthase III [Vicingaceae bacterium]
MKNGNNNVYINKSAIYLPNQPVSNDEMEDYLGIIKEIKTSSKKIVLRNNGIKNRYYAIDKLGKATHTNAEMTALAVRKLVEDNTNELKNVELLACGTSSPDQMMPSHGVMVHGWLPETSAIEVVSPSGNCCSGMHALKYAYLSIKSGEVENAISTGSERLSRVLRADTFNEEVEQLIQLKKDPFISFEKEFLRWMLSDGAGAFFLSNKKNETGLSIRIDWLESVSYAHEKETCMYMASEKLEDGTLKGYMDFDAEEIISKSVLSMKQDTKLLGENIVHLGFDKLKTICEKRNFNVDEVDYFLPHLSSEFFRSKIAQKLIDNQMEIPAAKWFTNLSAVGNVGAASVYLMIDELLNAGKLKSGNKIMLAVPESARFSYVFGLLTVC